MTDIRVLMRLLREVCELGEDPQAWRVHMLTALRELIGAGTSIHYLHDLPANPGNLRFRAYIDVGADPLWHEYVARGDVTPDPMTPEMGRLLGRTVVRSEDQLCSTGEWYSSGFFNEVCQPLRIDHEMVSVAVLPDGKSFSGIAFGRYLGDAPFARREREAVHLFHTELVELWRNPAKPNGNGQAATAQLPPRQRQTLELLHEGLSEKQIAVRLGISAHTVHDYVKALHQRFGACSTTELIVHTRVQRQFRPRLDFP